jgi:parvulin-like peptidyl-prolyl isomerase
MIKALQLFFILFLLTASCLAQADSKKNVAEVDSIKIPLSEFLEKYEQFLTKTGVQDNIKFREDIINSMIGDLILNRFDNNQKVYSSPDYNKEIAWVKKQAILAYLKDQEIYANIKISDFEIRQAFLHVNEKIAARHLYATTEKEAWSLYNQLNSGKDFKSLAKLAFTDTVLQNNGGYLGYFTWGDMDPDFEEAAYSMKIGEVSAPVKTAYGYSIIKLEDRVICPLLTENEFQKKKNHLERVLKIRKKGPSEKEFLSKVFDSRKLTFNNSALGKILNNLSVGKSTEVNKEIPESKCVTYNGKIYSQKEIENRLFEIPYFHRRKINSVELLKAAISGLMMQDVLYNIAIEKKYDSVPAVLNTIEGLNKKVFLQFKTLEILSGYKLPDSSTRKYYYDNIQTFSSNDEMNVQEIILPKKDFADSLKQLIISGKDFGDVAEVYSLRKWSARNKGIMGYADLSRYGVLKDTLWKSPVNEIIGPLRVNNQYGIFKVLGKVEGKPIDFLAIKDEVAKTAKNENQKAIVSDYINRLSHKLNIKVNRDVLTSAINITQVYRTPK